MIYPDDVAELMKKKAGKKYQPSNGTEGAILMDSWCVDCARDKPLSEGKDFDDCTDEEVCEIIAATMRYSVDDPNYPAEWQYGEDGQPMCTAFLSCEEETPPKRCPKTIDMFEEMRA